MEKTTEGLRRNDHRRHRFLEGGAAVAFGYADGRLEELAGSSWVEGSERRLVLIALHGLRGPIEVKGKLYQLEMPGFQNVFNDEDLAAILSYTRQSWGNDSRPVRVEFVAEVRAATANREDPWTVAELAGVE